MKRGFPKYIEDNQDQSKEKIEDGKVVFEEWNSTLLTLAHLIHTIGELQDVFD